MGERTSLRSVIDACLNGEGAHPHLTPRQWQVCCHVLDCRTEALGGLARQCDQCGNEVPQFHSCRDRHCPVCQRRASEDWCRRQREAVLPVTYHHLVITLPHTLNPWVEVHDRELYDLLFASVWATLSAFGADSKRLNGQLGMTAVLHTWGQALTRHVHLHCLVPGGALSAQGQWNAAKGTYLFPVRALSRHVRGAFVSRLRQAITEGRFPRLIDPAQIDTVLDTLMATEWVVYSKPCLARTETVVDYLGRYSHRIALSEARILDFDGQQVQFAYKDYRDGENKVMALHAEELMRRFLLHVLPKGFMRIRHFGFLANRCRGRRLGQIRTALHAQQLDTERSQSEDSGTEAPPCPKCRQGRLRVTGELAPKPRLRRCPSG